MGHVSQPLPVPTGLSREGRARRNGSCSLCWSYGLINHDIQTEGSRLSKMSILSLAVLIFLSLVVRAFTPPKPSKGKFVAPLAPRRKLLASVARGELLEALKKHSSEGPVEECPSHRRVGSNSNRRQPTCIPSICHIDSDLKIIRSACEHGRALKRWARFELDLAAGGAAPEMMPA